MRKWIQQLDRILRGDATRLPDLKEGRLEITARGIAVLVVLLGMIYGICMGIYAFIVRGPVNPAYLQLLASTVKVPALFLMTLLVTFPSLYVFNALVGSRLSLLSLLRLLVAALGVMLAVLASFGPIVGFFSICTTSYPFMTLLNVVTFAVAGLLGLIFLLQTLHRLTVSQFPSSQSVAPSDLGADIPQGALDTMDGQVLGSHVKTVFRIWVIVFGLVGAQMAWVLRPFIGSPDLPFSFFRARQSNFFEAIIHTIRNLLG